MPHPEWIDPICKCLQVGRQRATYGALARAIDYKGANPGQKGGNWMGQLQKNKLHSWIVARRSDNRTGARRGMPTGYVAEQRHSDLLVNPDIIEDGSELEAWLDEHCPNWRGNA